MDTEEELVDGASVVAESLRRQGVEYVFGVVGIPIVELAMAMQDVGVRFVGMRNEQAASYAASVIGYLTGRPAGCLVVPGPGMIHALPGVANATVNCWPLLLIAGAYDQDQGGLGAFQEWPQVDSCRPYVKYAARLESLESAPFHIEKAVRTSMYGRPGPCYIEVPGNMVTDRVDARRITYSPICPGPPVSLADPGGVKAAVETLKAAERPLVIIGKGAAYGCAEHEIRQLVSSHYLPFLPTPMGKGVVPDDHPLCVAAARSKALREADVILLLGARLNWILHFGRPPRFKPDVKIIQVDICPEEMGNNVSSHVMLVGHIRAVVNQMNEELSRGAYYACDRTGEWWRGLKEKVEANTRVNKELAADPSLPMSFYAAYNVINRFLPRNATIVNEGSSTMDVGRTVLMNYHPRKRLDAGTFATMGLGCGFAIAAALVNKNKPVGKQSPVVSIQGDSAFGFSGMEVETACRYQLPIIFIVMNNNGIYRGLDSESWKDVTDNTDLPLSIPPTSLLPGVHYEKIAEAFLAEGYLASTPQELHRALTKAFTPNRSLPVVINVKICPSSSRKAQEFSWLTRSKL